MNVGAGGQIVNCRWSDFSAAFCVVIGLVICGEAGAWIDSVESPYRRPIFFAGKDNGVEVLPPVIEWKVDASQIELSGTVFDTNQIRMHLSQSTRSETPRRYLGTEVVSHLATHMSFNFGSLPFEGGQLSLNSREDGKSFFLIDVKPEDLERVQRELQSESQEDFLQPHRSSQFALFDFNVALISKAVSRRDFQFCITQVKGTNDKSRICSPYYVMNVKNGKLNLVTSSEPVRPRVVSGGLELNEVGSLDLPYEKVTDFQVRFPNGARLRFLMKPKPLEIHDIITDGSVKKIFIIGHDLEPVDQPSYLVVPPHHFWSPTGLDEVRLWRVAVPFENPKVKVHWAWKIPIDYPLKFSQLPRFKDRAYLRRPPDSSSYSERPERFGYVRKEYDVTSSSGEVEKAADGEFRWRMNNPERGSRNKSYLEVRPINKQHKFIGNYQMFRGFPNEVSARATGLLSTDLQIVGLIEAASSHWFETLGSSNYYLSYQRWGATARYYRAISPVTVPTYNSKEPYQTLNPFSALNVEVKYNVFPGIWNRDELLGIMLSGQVLELGTHKTNNLGFGAYWARTMPKVFDDLFNLFWVFRHPKYVDMEFIYYPMTLTNGISLGANYQMNFHGKVFWTQRVYGEAGFGLKTYNFDDANTARKASQPDQVRLSTVYGTVGLGVVF